MHQFDNRVIQFELEYELVLVMIITQENETEYKVNLYH